MNGLRHIGYRKLAKWLEFCISIGWAGSYLDQLRDIWLQYHDEYGNLTLGEMK